MRTSKCGALALVVVGVLVFISSTTLAQEDRFLSVAQEEKLFSIVEAFLEADEWYPTRVEGETILRMNFQGDAASWRCLAVTNEEYEQFSFYSVLTNNVPENKRVPAAVYLTYANYGLTIGNFELDMSDGEVRYKTSIDVEGGQLTNKMIENMVWINVRTMDTYLPGLNKVVYGDADPHEAIVEIEGQ